MDEKPLVYTTPEIKEELQSSTKFGVKKVVFGFLIVVIFVELILGARYLFSTTARADQVSPLSDASVVLDSPNLSYQVGDTIPVNIRIATGGRMTDSADLIIKFDPNFLEPLSNSAKTGLIYADYPINEIESGTVKITGTTPRNTEGFVGVGNLGILNFKAKTVGKTKITVDFVKGATTDSNIIESGSGFDILANIYDLELGIGKNVSRVETKSCNSYIQYCHNITGQVGLQTCIAGKSSDNTCSYDPYNTVSCGLCEVNFTKGK